MRKGFVFLTGLFVAAVATTGSLIGQDEIKLLKEDRDRLQTICLISDVDQKASATNPRVVADKPFVGTTGTTVKIVGTSIRVTPEQLRSLTSDAVATFDSGFGTSSNRDAVIATMEWPFVRWPAAQGDRKFVPLGTESASIWQSSEGTDQRFERLGPRFEEKGCEGVLILGVYHKAGIRSRGILAREPITVAYLGVLAQMVDPKTRKVLYRKRVFSSEVPLNSSDFASEYLSEIAWVLPELYGDITSGKFPHLASAASDGDRDTVAKLLETGIDPNVRDRRGRTALQSAAKGRHTAVVQLLRKAGANPVGTDLELEEGLRKAAEKGDIESLQTLVQAGVNLEGQDAAGRTALHIAVEKGRAEIVSFLTESGARPDARSGNGQTPLDIARQKNNSEIVRFLEAPTQR